MARGNCRGSYGVMFRHQCKSTCGSNGCNDENARIAKAVCDGCPVLPQCRFWSIVTAEPDGISGKMTTTERRRLRRRLSQANMVLNDYRRASNATDEED